MKNIKIVIKKPNETPFIDSIPDTLEAMQETVGGYIETVSIASNLVIVCNEEGRLMDLPYNCSLFGIDFFGTIFLIGRDEKWDFADIPISIEDANIYGFLRK